MQSTILFDLDGTLVDTLPDLTSSLNRALASAELQPFATSEVAAMIGDGMQVLATRALAARFRPFDPSLFALFQTDYLAHLADASRPYPGTPETLATLADSGALLAVATNKPEAAARKLLQALDLAKFFAAIGGGDSFPARKPDPRHLLLTIDRAGGTAAGAIMLGDHANDMQAARAAGSGPSAGITPLFALWGYGRPEMAGGAEALSKISELPRLLADRREPAPMRPF